MAAIWALASGCRSFSLPAPGVAEQARAASTLNARLGVSLRGPDVRGRATVLLAFERPDALRVEIPGPGGPRVALVARGGRATAAFPGDRAFWEGEASAASLEAVLGIALAPGEIMDLVVGVVPPSVSRHRVAWGQRLPARIETTLSNGSRLTIRIEEAEADVPLSPRAFEPPRREGYRQIGSEEVRNLWR